VYVFSGTKFLKFQQQLASQHVSALFRFALTLLLETVCDKGEHWIQLHRLLGSNPQLLHAQMEREHVNFVCRGWLVALQLQR
jgi:hypothetical protein